MHIQPRPTPRAIPPQCTAPFITFLHPGYLEPENSFLALPPLDVASGHDATDATTAEPRGSVFGIHHATALAACQIIAGNSFEHSFLSYDRAGLQRVEVPSQGLLTRRNYYLQVPTRSNNGDAARQEDEPWAVTPNFQNWRFPHNRLPEPWASYRMMRTDPSRPSPLDLPHLRCIVTAAGPSTADHAHIIPQSSAAWFDQNNMTTYALSNTALSAADSPGNSFRLRSDLHKDFDARAFALVPKPTTTTSSAANHVMALHFISISDEMRDSAAAFHNQSVYGDDIPTEYLFARFAYTVFGLMKKFILQGHRRRVLLVEAGTIDWTTKAHDLDAKSRDEMFGGGGTRSSSPRKRIRGPVLDANHCEVLDDDDEVSMTEEEASSILSGAMGYQSGDEEERRRGRSRTRKCSREWEDEGPDVKRRRVHVESTPSLSTSMTSLDSAPRSSSSSRGARDGLVKEAKAGLRRKEAAPPSENAALV